MTDYSERLVRLHQQKILRLSCIMLAKIYLLPLPPLQMGISIEHGSFPHCYAHISYILYSWVIIEYSENILSPSHIGVSPTHHRIHPHVKEMKYTSEVLNKFPSIHCNITTSNIYFCWQRVCLCPPKEMLEFFFVGGFTVKVSSIKLHAFHHNNSWGC